MMAPRGLSIEEKCHWHLEAAKENGAFHDVDGPMDTPCIEIDYDKAPGINRGVGGYPQISIPISNAKVRFGRFLYSLFHGDPVNLQPGSNKGAVVIRHRCDRPSCVNPRHLEKGSQSDNMNDSYRRGRKPVGCAGEKHHNSKITKQDVIEIRDLYAKGGISLGEIGKRYGMRRESIFHRPR